MVHHGNHSKIYYRYDRSILDGCRMNSADPKFIYDYMSQHEYILLYHGGLTEIDNMNKKTYSGWMSNRQMWSHNVSIFAICNIIIICCIMKILKTFIIYAKIWYGWIPQKRNVVLLSFHVHEVYYEQNMLYYMGLTDIYNMLKYLLWTDMEWSELAAFFVHEYVCAAYTQFIISYESFTDIHNK